MRDDVVSPGLPTSLKGDMAKEPYLSTAKATKGNDFL